MAPTGFIRKLTLYPAYVSRSVARDKESAKISLGIDLNLLIWRAYQT
jgi:hypothetical protein